MFNHIGENIKGFARLCTALGIVVSIIVAIIMCTNGGNIVLGLLCLLIGALISWMSSWALYGFGEIVEAAMRINRKLKESDAQMNNHSNI